VYVAGAYSADNVIDVLANMGRGMRAAAKVFEAGMAPFCPWFDYHYSILASRPVRVEEFYRYSEAWLAVSDCVIVVPERATASKGTQAELALATELGIPVFWEDTVEKAIEKAKAHFAPPADDPKYPWLVVRKSDEHAIASFKTCKTASDYLGGMAGTPDLPGTKSDYYVREYRKES
jgi:hypothetical protein